MANFRIFVEKQLNYNVEAQQLLLSFNQNLHLNLKTLRVINLYDVFNVSNEELERAKYVVFAEPTVDILSDEIELVAGTWFAVEPLPGQYDQRADSALQALNLLAINANDLAITTGKILIFDQELSSAQLEQIKHYYINPLEMTNKDLDVLQADVQENNFMAVPVYHDFNQFSPAELVNFRREHGLAMSDADLVCIQDYFKYTELRNPTETEIKVLDTYWSDHCRHTTFETQLTDINIKQGAYQDLFNDSLANYLSSREFVHYAKLDSKPITLMDLATICAKQLRKQGKLAEVEITDEINACSLVIDIEVDSAPQKWSLQFKNETHNHPTEIEPYGGASTCVGGAIRDPLSGRSYVYQAMRVSGAANPLEAIEDTLVGKLPQKIITTKAAHGFSSYGNQIGLATTHVREIYHPGYKAKRMEVGMVVAAAPYANIRREQPVAGDVIILLGGKTGRDGCGGATGSSKEHDVNSATQCSAEVQKGNPVVERKIQRLFRNPAVTRLIKKCNDFGAGGVSVAIGELADGVAINLDLVPTKYNGLTGTELAISESQERMAVVVSAVDAEKFIALAEAENLAALVVAQVTAELRMVMLYRGVKIVNLSREFLNTNGAKSYAKIELNSPLADGYNFKVTQGSDFVSQYQELVQNLNVCSQQGLVDAFDASIGSGTVLMPFGGKYQLSPTQVSVQKLPLLTGQTNAASIASFGFDPDLSSWSSFHGAFYAVVDSVAKIVAAGGERNKIYFSFQEYFERLGSDPIKWGKPFAALLGAYTAQQGFELAAIGGKDSMSGSFNELHVPPTLISFAVAPCDARQIISPELKTNSQFIYAYLPEQDEQQMLDLAQLCRDYARISELIHGNSVHAARAIGAGGIAEALFLMAIGNKIGVQIEQNQLDLFKACYGGIIIASETELNLPALKLIATTNTTAKIIYQEQSLALENLIQLWQAKLAPVFPLAAPVVKTTPVSLTVKPSANPQIAIKSAEKFAQPRVIVPVFPGTNCEYDSARAFAQAGATASSLVFNNLSPHNINQSLAELVQAIDNSQILMLPGGFSAGDEPDGSAKFIATILRNQQISDAVQRLLAREGLILGICNGFQALIKSGLLPYGEICSLTNQSPTLTYNLIGRHISRVVPTKIVNNQSPWLSSFEIGAVKQIAMSHGEGRLIISPELYQQLAENGQIACQYSDLDGQATFDPCFNPNGSDYAIEALTSLDGRILGKMGHSERMGQDLYKNILGDKQQDIFINGVNYFK